MFNSPIDEIKNRLNIVDVIGSYIKLQKTGANFRAVCPFHSEKKPSFFVSPARQIWHCFGCSKGGDIFAFVREIEGVEFGDALRLLAQKAGVELKPIKKEVKTERQRLYEICELACCFFEKQLKESKVGREAEKYLLSRSISKDSIKKWRLGYAPDVWQGLSDFLNSQGYKKEEIEKAGLGLTSEKGSFYDRFRGRIIFPIFDLNSQVIGFGGRVFKEKDKSEIAKYVNTPNTLLYDKSRILYGLDKAKVEIRRKDGCILVEGYTDVILLSQSGFENVVATSGTALTPFQLKILKRYTDNLFLAFDMDVAGDTATKRGIDLAHNLGFNIKILLMPDKDPADLVAKNPTDFEKILSQAKSILEFYFESAFSKFDKNTIEGKKEISKILLPVIKRIANEIEKSFWVQQLAKNLETKEEVIIEELKKIKPTTEEFFNIETEEIFSTIPKNRRQLLEERLTGLILKNPEIFESLNKDSFQFISQKFCQIINYFLEKKSFDGLDPELVNLANSLILKSEIENEQEIDSINECNNCLCELKNLEIKEKLEKLSKEIKKAEEEKDNIKIEKLTQEFLELSSDLTKI